MTKIYKKILVIICVLAIILPISSEVLAKIANSSAGSKQNFGISLMHSSKKLNGELNIGFGYGIDATNAYRIYSESDNYEGYIDTVLCLNKDGKFPREENTTNRGEYTSLGEATESNLKQAKSSIDSQDARQIQWLINNALIPEDSPDLRNQKLTKIFLDMIKSTETTANPITIEQIKKVLTEDDIVFAFQCAIWEITNNISEYVLRGTSDNGDTWDGLEGNDKWGYKGAKGIYIRQIINYYRNHCNDDIEVDATPKTDPTFDNSLPIETTILGAHAFIGPFKINSATNYYSVDISFQNIAGDTLNNVSYLLTDRASDQNAKVLSRTKEDLEGKEFYIRLNVTSSARKVKIRLATQIEVESSIGTVWTDGNINDQALLSIKRKETPGKEIETEADFQIRIANQYDASLRKYITTIKRAKTTTLGTPTTEIINLADIGATRVPSKEEALGQEPFNQYVYNHRKDPVKVQVGDLVVYTIRITNECKNTMKILSVTDYLQQLGIEYVSEDDVYRNENNKWSYSDDTRTAITTKEGGWTLEPGQHQDIEIVCRVTEEAKGKIVTNIAEITQIADEYGNPVIDIDSQPDNIELPKTDKEWSEYEGNEGITPDKAEDLRYDNKDDLTDEDYYYKGQQDDDDFEKIIVEIPSQEYDLEILKVDQNEENLPLANAQFEITLPDGSTQLVNTGIDGKAKTKKIIIKEQGIDNIKIVEKVPPSGYNKLISGFDVWVEKVIENGTYKVGEATVTSILKEYQVELNGNTIRVTIPNEKEKPKETEYDLQIVKVDKDQSNKKLEGAKFSVTLPDGATKQYTTQADGSVKTETIPVKQEGTDIITVKETEAPQGYNKIIDTIEIEVTKVLEGKEYIAKTVSIKNNITGVTARISGNTIILTVQDEKQHGNYNFQLIKVDQEDTNKKLAGAEFDVTLPDGTKEHIITDSNGIANLKPIEITEVGTYTIKLTETATPKGYSTIAKEFDIEVEINLEDGEYKVITAEIINGETASTIEVADNTVILTVKNKLDIYDLALKKFITSIMSANGTNKIIPDEQKRKLEVTNVDALVNRIGNEKADATYQLNKTPVDVTNGDYVTYTIRIFNEGNLNAVVKEIVDTVPKGLEFVPYETNSDGTYKSGSKTNYTYKWEEFKDKKTETGWTEGVRTKYLIDKDAIPAFDKTNESGENKELGLSYTEVKIEFKVNLSNLKATEKDNILQNGIKNIAEITNDDGDDNDSTPDNKKEEEDDEDYDIVIPKEFDLALRKFITKINEKDILDRVPKVTYTDKKIKYEHTKEPKIVVEGQTVTYTIRVYNEGTIDGYATEITDDLPKGITFLPKHETNIQYEWKMYDAEDNETDDVNKAVKIKTNYLSRDKSVDNLLKAFDSSKQISDTNPDFKEVKVAFEVTQNSVTEGNKVIINTAQISEDEDKDGNPIDDVDSTPGNGKEDEDDIDKEYLILKYFDLALLKYVSKVIVTEDGVTKETETGYTGEENPEPIVKVELNKKKLDKTEIKYIYSIKITNQGEIEGYATEITDRIPDGLEFYEEDNTQFRWKKQSDGIATTDYLKETLLKPGESAIVPIVLRWKRDKNNLGQKVNIAEISADDNEYDVPDIDSTPNNNKDGEDDQDNAIVVLSIKTGSTPTYITFIIGILSMLAIGLYNIYKFVIKR